MMAKHLTERGVQYRSGGPRGHTRRAVLLLIGGGGIAGWTLTSKAASALAPVAADSVEAAVVGYLQARVTAVNSRQASAVFRRIDPANKALAEHEVERVGHVADLGSPRKWNGRMGGFTTVPGLVSVHTSGSSSTVRAYEELRVRWQPTPVELAPDMRAIAERDPQRYGLDRPAGEWVESQIGVAHELTLERGRSGWVITSDAYAEEDMFPGPSPDAGRSPWATGLDTSGSTARMRADTARMRADTAGRPDEGTSEATARIDAEAQTDAEAQADAETVRFAASRLYSWRKAVAYADKYWRHYNPAYPNYSSRGGDCANFVSQCLRAGGETTDRTWRVGSVAWVNNWGLRNWLMRTHRGRAVSSINRLGRGDIVNYDWTGNGTFDHVAIITNSRYMLVTQHSTNRHNVPWSRGAARHRFTWVLGHY